jgi:triosephosphate isomerase
MNEAAPAIRPLIAGNWKMHGLGAQLAEIQAISAGIGKSPGPAADVMICPPATLLAQAAAAARGSKLLIGAQDCHPDPSGAYTGDIAAEMLKDAGAAAVIVGHSERRALNGELDRTVRRKAEAAHRAGLAAIVCVGETAGERAAGLTLRVVERQLAASMPGVSSSSNAIVAYEPVWAIGTGLTPRPADVVEVHAAIRAALASRFSAEGRAMRILYGGSVNPQNARELLSLNNVNGALVGGASLKARDFLGIVAAYQH